jgi:hypothetical protein
LWGVLLGCATFFYKDVLLPHAVPVNISLNLELKKISGPDPPAGSNGQSLIAIEMQLAATNPSSREIYLLPNVWIAYGYHAKGTSFEAAAFAERLNRSLSRHVARPAERYASTSDGVPLAGGTLLNDSRLKPNEKVVRKLVFYLPKNTYDAVEVWTAIPSTSKAGKLKVTWRLKGNEMVPEVNYADKAKGPVPKDTDGAFIDNRLELQESSSRVAMSLWE